MKTLRFGGLKASIAPDTKEFEKGENAKYTISANNGYEIKDVKVDGKSIGAISTYTFENIKKEHTITAEFIKTEIVISGDTNSGDMTSGDVISGDNISGDTISGDVETWENKFSDVKEDDWYYDSVKFVNSKGLFKGISDDNFGASVTMNRAMIVTVLYRYTGEKDVTSDINFNDVEKDAYYTNAVVWAVENGVVNGTGNNAFSPESSVTREQLVVMLYRFAKTQDIDVTQKADLENYADKDLINDYAEKAFEWAVQTGLVSGRTSTELVPQGTATRAEVATILMRFIQQ